MTRAGPVNTRGRWLLVALLLVLVGRASADVVRAKFISGGNYLVIELLDDELAHFESGVGAGPPTGRPLDATPMVLKRDYTGPGELRANGPDVFETAAMRIVVDPGTLCTSVTDTQRSPPVELTRICPTELVADTKTLTIAPLDMRNAYGLGEQFITPGEPNGDWIGRVRTPGCAFGNRMVAFLGGAVGNAQFPILYALGPADAALRPSCYGLFYDNVYAQTWRFDQTPWSVAARGPVCWYVLAGGGLPEVRSKYLELVGRPPVPPRKLFGLWVSEFGFDDWQELEQRLESLRAGRFPVDGFVLDLQWFGGVRGGDEHSRMGTLTWDESRFPAPAAKIAELRDKHGVGVIPIEEPYVCAGLPEHVALGVRGLLTRTIEGGEPVHFKAWWGAGGMLDWTNPLAGDYWHDDKRQALVDVGVCGHWTDLGEPEQFSAVSWSYGFPAAGRHGQADIQNIYNLCWSESIQRGYTRSGVPRRPAILSRSGTSGSQRCGVLMWSGDIGSNLASLATHMNAQMHMSLSGMDYFGADSGGFHRRPLDGDLNELYTVWFANTLMLDVPIRPHTENLCNCRYTAPNCIGEPESNLQNLRLRYALTPYLYSLAHQAFRTGEAIFPPLVYRFPADRNVRELGDHKLIGRDLLVAIVTNFGLTWRPVYLPAGRWFDFRSDQERDSPGRWYYDVPLRRAGIFSLPLFARGGAIIPQMYVDEQTMNAQGRQLDGKRHDEMIVRVYADETPSAFLLYEDDGETRDYQTGAVRQTVIKQEMSRERVSVSISAALGTYAGAVAARNNIVRLVTPSPWLVAGASLNGESLPLLNDSGSGSRGWSHVRDGVYEIESGELPVAAEKRFEFTLKESNGRTLLAPAVDDDD